MLEWIMVYVIICAAAGYAGYWLGQRKRNKERARQSFSKASNTTQGDQILRVAKPTNDVRKILDDADRPFDPTKEYLTTNYGTRRGKITTPIRGPESQNIGVVNPGSMREELNREIDRDTLKALESLQKAQPQDSSESTHEKDE